MQSDRQPIATRIFENADGLIELQIFAPVVEHGKFTCSFTIRWANGRVKELKADGVDSMQALLLAISAARVNMLYPKVGQRDESLRFLGNGDLGLDIIAHH